MHCATDGTVNASSAFWQCMQFLIRITLSFLSVYEGAAAIWLHHDQLASSKCMHMACRLGDEAEALRCYQDAHRMFPANMDVISWLGAFHVKNEVKHCAHSDHCARFFHCCAD